MGRWKRAHIPLLGLLVVAAISIACGGGCGDGGGTVVGPDCTHIGFLLPDSIAMRWEAEDRPEVTAAIQRDLSGSTIDTLNAQGNAATQQAEAESELTRGACILVVAAVDSSAAASIVTEAHAKHVPVIAYDRLIYSDKLDYYVSFDGKAVGVTQATYIMNNYQKYVTQNGNNNIAFIDGSGTDSYTHLFADGAHSVLDPLIASGALHKVYEQFTPNWDSTAAQLEAQAALTANQNQIAIWYVMNDGLAKGVVAALRAQGLAGRVLVTGLDASATGITNILLGYQSMTVYGPIKELANSVGRLVAAISKHESTTSITNSTSRNPNGYANIPSVLNAVVAVDTLNIKTTVIADGSVTKADVCQGVPAGTAGVC